MLYRPSPLDFEREILVFVHIPKTAGTALDDTLVARFGAERCLFARLEKIGKIHASKMRKFVWEGRKAARNGLTRLLGRDPLLPKDFDPAQLDRLCLLDGHFALGAEPATGRAAIYITLVRDPVDRFLSDYYFRFDIRAGWREGKRERRAFWTYEVDQFVDYVYRRRSWSDTNLQCRYLGGRGDFATAKEAVDSRIFLAAPCNRIDECVELLRPVLGPEMIPVSRVNIGRARQVRATPSVETLSKIREMVSQDQLLYDYVSRKFDTLSSRTVTSESPSAEELERRRK